MPDYLKMADVKPDYPDSRDWIYRPALNRLKPEMPPPDDLYVLNQRSEGACTGFALAAVINLLNWRNRRDVRVSARMLYEMAKRHDEWRGEQYSGSSLRGAIHGWKSMGVCRESLWKYYVNPARRGDLTVERAKDARNYTLGAYYRLRPVVSDYHAALNETGVVAVSAKVHKGWNAPDPLGQIPHHKDDPAQHGHAFAIVGYDADGFWIQNSWGASWGQNGLALWRYEDWVHHIMDGWVFRLALPTPQIFGLSSPHAIALVSPEAQEVQQAGKSAIRRSEIAGHFVHIDDGRFAANDRYWSTAFDVTQTARLVAESKKYQHIVFYGHGGLNPPKASAERIAAMKGVFKANGVYPYHIMYDTGIVEELRDLILTKGNKAAKRVGGAEDWLDRTLELLTRLPGRLLWQEMKQDASDAFSKEGAGTEALKIFIENLRKAPPERAKKIHLIGHSTGAVLFAYLLKTLSRYKFEIESCSLLAPACTLDLYQRTYLPVLAGERSLRLNQLEIYNLLDRLERNDVVLSKWVYRKSLLYLVSNAFEARPPAPLLGMAKYVKKVPRVKDKPIFYYSNGTSSRQTLSRTHGGFDNDARTLNTILRRILGQVPKRPFRAQDLDFG